MWLTLVREREGTMVSPEERKTRKRLFSEDAMATSAGRRAIRSAGKDLRALAIQSVPKRVVPCPCEKHSMPCRKTGRQL